MKNPYSIVRDFEEGLCEYTGAKYAVTTNSCTMALLLAVAWHKLIFYKKPRPWLGVANQDKESFDIDIPKRTYVSVPMAVIHAGGQPRFTDCGWSGAYRLNPLPVVDSARRFTSGMYCPGQMQCVSFHASKILGDTQGGAILHDDPEADAWLRRARFDGRTEGVAPKDDDFTQIGWHCYMSVDVAARLLMKLRTLPLHNPDLPNDDYPDLSKLEIFK